MIAATVPAATAAVAVVRAGPRSADWGGVVVAAVVLTDAAVADVGAALFSVGEDEDGRSATSAWSAKLTEGRGGIALTPASGAFKTVCGKE
jgi:hypothetical protein